MAIMSSFGLRRRRPVNVWGISPYYDAGPMVLSSAVEDIKRKLLELGKEPDVIKKFYVGARHIGQSIQHGSNADCTRFTIDEAIEDAKKQIQGGADCVVIVKIVRIVRKDFPPITIENVE